MNAPGRILARGLSRRFGPTQAVHPFDLDIEPGEVTGLIGPNGSGKSTFLRMLLGIVPADAGTATVAGAPLVGDGTEIRRRTSSMPGEIGLYGEMSGKQHLAWFARGRASGTREKSLAIASELGLPTDRRVRGYSHGMKRQLLFAAAMAPPVSVRIMDEPTEGLDPAKRSHVLDLLTAEAARGTTVLLSSHHLVEMDRSCGRLIFLNQGKLIGDESAADITQRASNLLAIEWGDEQEAERRKDALQARFDQPVRRYGTRTCMVSGEPGPAAILAYLYADDGQTPAPHSITYGRPSLADLYRDLYGVEGV